MHTPEKEFPGTEPENGSDTLRPDEIQYLADLVAKGAMHKAFFERVLARQDMPQTHAGLSDDSIRRGGYPQSEII